MANIPCNTTEYCQDYFQAAGSQCLWNDAVNATTCTNPFAMGGCLYNMKPGWTQPRVCNSEDDPSNGEQYCRPILPASTGSSFLPYQEVRFLSQNWESAFMSAWIQQILLSELLHVPTSMETGVPGKQVQFYDPFLSLDYGTSNDWDALQRATELGGDCTQATRNAQTCAHVNVEVWEGQSELIQNLVDANLVEPSLGNGALGQQSWYIPRITALKDPTLLNHLGLRGEENREKMARTFLKPTTWQEYCELVSSDQCETPDDRATRAPVEDDEELGLYYLEDEYRGYFRFTDDNNCTLNPTTCHGFMVDFPCGWSSYTLPQAFWNDIAILPLRYSYGELLQIWAAANETQSDLLLHWWTPEAQYQSMVGTQFELLRVSLPPANQDCIEARITPLERCSDSVEEQLGDPLGACDEPSFPLQKVLTKSLYTMSKDQDQDGNTISQAEQSPAYDFIKGFTISDFQLGKIFDYWLEAPFDNPSYDLRYASCRWVVENLEDLQAQIPRTYPRVLEDQSDHLADALKRNPLHIVALSLSICSTVLILVVCAAVYRQRHRRVLQHAQLEFVGILLVGLVLVSLAALVLALPPDHWSCIAVTWLFNIGYTLELVPLVVKIAAISQMMRAAKKCRRVVLERAKLFRVVAGLCLLVVVFLSIWTGLDPPHKQTEYKLTTQQQTTTQEGGMDATIVTTTSYCRSQSEAWRFISVTWHVVMLLTATVLAFQTRKLQHGINESQALAILIYSHFFFVVLRVVTFFLEDSIGDSQAALSRSILLSADIIATAFIYFLPKLLSSDTADERKSAQLQPHSYNSPLKFMATSSLASAIASTPFGSSSKKPTTTKAPQNSKSGTSASHNSNNNNHNEEESFYGDDHDNMESNDKMEDIESFDNVVLGSESSSKSDERLKENGNGDDNSNNNNHSAPMSGPFNDEIMASALTMPETAVTDHEQSTLMSEGFGLRCRHCGLVN